MVREDFPRYQFPSRVAVSTSVDDRLRIFNGNSDEFCRLISEFDAVLKLHDQVCVSLPLDALPLEGWIELELLSEQDLASHAL